MKTLIAVGILVVLGWYLPFWSHTVTPDERTHIKHAVEYIEQFQNTNSRLPTHKEFLTWGAHEGLHGTRYGGKGFTLRENCVPLKAVFRLWVPSSRPYCLDFWEGDVWVTYWSWQISDDAVVINDAGGIVLFTILFGVLLFVLSRKPSPVVKVPKNEGAE